MHRKKALIVNQYDGSAAVERHADRAAWAQSGSGFDLHWNVIAGGGGDMKGGGYSVSSTIGQSVNGSSSGSGFTLGSGYWYENAPYRVMLPVITKN